jgi:hypothetical protein
MPFEAYIAMYPYLTLPLLDLKATRLLVDSIIHPPYVFLFAFTKLVREFYGTQYQSGSFSLIKEAKE